MDMTGLGAAPVLLGALVVGAISPGPSFVVVARTSAARGCRQGCATALGIGAASLAFATVSALGFVALVASVEGFYIAARVAGGLYLLHVAYRLWGSGATSDHGASRSPSERAPFRSGLVTQLCNPKTAVVYAGVFTALLPEGTTPPTLIVVAMGTFAVEAGWYTVVAVAFSTARIRAGYARAERWLDRVAGVVIGALGLRLIAHR